MKKLFTLVFLAVCGVSYSQDVIVKTYQDSILAKVLEIGLTGITYKKYENPEGPSYVIPIADVSVIKYQNGTVDTFNLVQHLNSSTEFKPMDIELFKKGQMDAARYYDGYRGAVTGTLLVSLLSPIVGLVPAIACSSTRPREINLNYPSAELFKKDDYRQGYKNKSFNIKSRKVWTNWTIAFGVNVVLAFLLLSGN